MFSKLTRRAALAAMAAATVFPRLVRCDDAPEDVADDNEVEEAPAFAPSGATWEKVADDLCNWELAAVQSNYPLTWKSLHYQLAAKYCTDVLLIYGVGPKPEATKDYLRVVKWLRKGDWLLSHKITPCGRGYVILASLRFTEVGYDDFRRTADRTARRCERKEDAARERGLACEYR